MSKGWIGVDLDGTLAHYDGWVSEEDIGEPIEAMAARVRQWLANGIEVRIFTARVGPQPGRDIEHVKTLIEDWSFDWFGVRLPVANEKDYGMVELWDDRCVQVIPNTGQRADGQP